MEFLKKNGVVNQPKKIGDEEDDDDQNNASDDFFLELVVLVEGEEEQVEADVLLGLEEVVDEAEEKGNDRHQNNQFDVHVSNHVRGFPFICNLGPF